MNTKRNLNFIANTITVLRNYISDVIDYNDRFIEIIVEYYSYFLSLQKLIKTGEDRLVAAPNTIAEDMTLFLNRFKQQYPKFSAEDLLARESLELCIMPLVIDSVDGIKFALLIHLRKFKSYIEDVVSYFQVLFEIFEYNMRIHIFPPQYPPNGGYFSDSLNKNVVNNKELQNTLCVSMQDVIKSKVHDTPIVVDSNKWDCKINAPAVPSRAQPRSSSSVRIVSSRVPNQFDVVLPDSDVNVGASTSSENVQMSSVCDFCEVRTTEYTKHIKTVHKIDPQSLAAMVYKFDDECVKELLTFLSKYSGELVIRSNETRLEMNALREIFESVTDTIFWEIIGAINIEYILKALIRYNACKTEQAKKLNESVRILTPPPPMAAPAAKVEKEEDVAMPSTNQYQADDSDDYIVEKKSRKRKKYLTMKNLQEPKRSNSITRLSSEGLRQAAMSEEDDENPPLLSYAQFKDRKSLVRTINKSFTEKVFLRFTTVDTDYDQQVINVDDNIKLVGEYEITDDLLIVGQKGPKLTFSVTCLETINNDSVIDMMFADINEKLASEGINLTTADFLSYVDEDPTTVVAATYVNDYSNSLRRRIIGGNLSKFSQLPDDNEFVKSFRKKITGVINNIDYRQPTTFGDILNDPFPFFDFEVLFAYYYLTSIYNFTTQDFLRGFNGYKQLRTKKPDTFPLKRFILKAAPVEKIVHLTGCLWYWFMKIVNV